MEQKCDTSLMTKLRLYWFINTLLYLRIMDEHIQLHKEQNLSDKIACRKWGEREEEHVALKRNDVAKQT